MLFKIGVDNGYNTGYFCVADKIDGVIIDAFPFPQKSSINNKEINALKKRLQENKFKFEIQRKRVEREIKFIESCTPRLVKEFFEKIELFAKYTEYAIIEKPIIQTVGGSTIQTYMSLSESYSFAKSVFDYFDIKYFAIYPATWRKQFNYKKPSKKMTAKEKREHRKQESIRLAKEKIINIKDFWIPEGCRKINDNICESALLSLVEIDKIKDKNE